MIKYSIVLGDLMVYAVLTPGKSRCSDYWDVEIENTLTDTYYHIPEMTPREWDCILALSAEMDLGDDDVEEMYKDIEHLLEEMPVECRPV